MIAYVDISNINKQGFFHLINCASRFGFTHYAKSKNGEVIGFDNNPVHLERFDSNKVESMSIIEFAGKKWRNLKNDFS